MRREDGWFSWPVFHQTDQSLVDLLRRVGHRHVPQGAAHGLPPGGVGEQPGHKRVQLLQRTPLRQQYRAAGVGHPGILGLVVGHHVGEGTSTAGLAMAAISAMVDAPARHSTRSAVAITRGMS